MEDEFDYESLGTNSTMAQNAIAGALAGIGEHCVMYPVDSIKVKYLLERIVWCTFGKVLTRNLRCLDPYAGHYRNHLK